VRAGRDEGYASGGRSEPRPQRLPRAEVEAFAPAPVRPRPPERQDRQDRQDYENQSQRMERPEPRPARPPERQDHRQDVRQEMRQDLRQELRQEPRRDQGQDQRQDQRQEQRRDQRQERAEPPLTAPGPGGNNRGWLSDLLSRASREEGELAQPPAPRDQGPRPGEERSPRHSIESLDSLSVDIARMIDHDAAVDLWDRYKRGERNVFTRRLYTLQGQKAFDEVRTKYRAERDFKQTVDRYITEFERLLDEVSRDDRGQLVARTYLTSETGKVYTMLAHAAGRFD
jgi:hypothetical protein